MYENVALGIIAQRIGECRLANRYMTGLYQLVTQQIRSLEKYYRDSVVVMGDKIIVVDFKAPYPDAKGLKYIDINVDALMKIAKMIGYDYDSVFLALIHAYLHPSYIPGKTGSGFYLWFAVPGTTAFIPLSELIRATGIKTGRTHLIVTSIHPNINMRYVATQIPSCIIQPTPIVKREPYCASCGGLFYGSFRNLRPSLRTPRLYIEVNGKVYIVRSYTFASLIKSFSDCRIGYTIKREEDFHEIIVLLREYGRPIPHYIALFVLNVNAGRSISLIYPSIIREDILVSKLILGTTRIT